MGRSSADIWGQLSEAGNILGQWGPQSGQYQFADDNKMFDVNVDRVGTAGERALDKAIYGNVYDTQSTAGADWRASDAGQQTTANQLRDKRQSLMDFYNMLGL